MNFSSLTSIDFYVSVIDNYGDMGFAVNFALSLHKKYPNLTIRFFSDDKNLFQKFLGENSPEWVKYLPLEILGQPNPPSPSELICSFFDYPLQKAYLSGFPYHKTIVSFSYFLLHNELESLHKTTYILESGYDTIIHFIPSLLSGGGGVIINPEIERRKEGFSKLSKMEAREKFIKGQTLEIYTKKWISVFVYEKTLKNLLEEISKTSENTVFFLFGGDFSETDIMRENIVWMPFLSLEDYGVFQSLCDANIVRGENSLCQGLISGKPILWDIYKESNGAHTDKIEDYLAFLTKQFPNADWEEYSHIMREFNDSSSQKQVFSDFISKYSEYTEVFGGISEYVKNECNLVEKLEEILE
ncbi:elongation factor P maturation arginine rhamnosyltransferase EarP [Candidatus Gracilibacteria bacterium]|nr:elongation factor P maturation arginine rhamnosyltransferase EarP [Candidatus Gracilibacteria bacterium]OIO76696.1 MAG: hypothetical protein AUJ87_02230 [Candidatus Gracilibacteria bacterium CG1_02_38_174]PIQ11875.1 MAG: hypothetical protein COW68_01555 [Candidatus Gracilibacteria bacterium CG18_big_fil_WC_8_21_14_2_50_38_16]